MSLFNSHLQISSNTSATEIESDRRLRLFTVHQVSHETECNKQTCHHGHADVDNPWGMFWILHLILQGKDLRAHRYHLYIATYFSSLDLHSKLTTPIPSKAYTAPPRNVATEMAPLTAGRPVSLICAAYAGSVVIRW